MSLGLHHTPLPKGFFASGINSGVRRYRPDLGLIYSEVDCVAAGVFTLNQLRAAPILYSQNLLPSNTIRAVITNSGQANAGTGPQGEASNLQMAATVARHLNLNTTAVLTASTGVIGKQLEIDKITLAIPELIERASDVADGFALSILTTDLVPKSVSTTVPLSGGDVQITGICKGSGMIHPQMGTMLGYILTDAVLEQTQAQDFLKQSTDVSFNMISVDGDCSTNDCSFLLANGLSLVSVVTAQDIAIFKTALIEVCQFLAKAIASDGEGATKLIEVELKGSPTLELARRAARGVILSPLVKTAMHGEDPNWGRVIARLGAEQVPLECLNKMTLKIQGQVLFTAGHPEVFNFDHIKQSLKKNCVHIEIDLASGDNTATAWGCDLSKRYITINTEYS